MLVDNDDKLRAVFGRRKKPSNWNWNWNRTDASKCKKLIKQAWRQLEIQKSMRNSIIRQSCEDIPQLLMVGQHEKAFAKVEELYMDMCMEYAYHQLDHFCSCVYANLHYLSKGCILALLPSEAEEAVSSIIYAGSRCGGLHALYLLQILLRDRYGYGFESSSVELWPGKMVNDEMKENLCVNSVPDDVKLRLIRAIVEEYLVQAKPETEASEQLEMPRKSKPSCSSLDSDRDHTHSSIVIMFNKLCAVFGKRKTSNWTKASKCKKLTEETWHQLKIQKNKWNAMIRQSRADIAQQLKVGQYDRAFAKVEQLYKDMCLEYAYDQLGHFCTCICDNLDYISKDCNLALLPTEAKEAVSSLVFASSRCGGLYDLYLLQILFRERYGCEFVKINVELLPGNYVNDKIKKHMCISSVPDDVKHQLIRTIAEEYLVETRPWDGEMKGSEQMEEIPRKSESSCSSSYWDFVVNFLAKSDQESTESTSGSACSSPTTEFTGVYPAYEETLSTGTTSDGLYEIGETNIVYLDDVNEQSSIQEDSRGKDELPGIASWDGSGSFAGHRKGELSG